MLDNTAICEAMTIKLGNDYPDYPQFNEGIRRAPDRGFRLTKEQTKIALKNALRYVPEELHEKLAPEFMEELATRGRIYAYRYRPEGRIYGKPISEYKGRCLAGKAFQVMIENNLDFEVALYPYELVTYGDGSGLSELAPVQTDKEISRRTDRRADSCRGIGTPLGAVSIKAGSAQSHHNQLDDDRHV